MKCSQGKK